MRLGLLALVVVTSTVFLLLQKWDPPMAILVHLGATEGREPAPETPRLELELRPVVPARPTENPRVVAALQTIGSGVTVESDADGVAWTFAPTRDRLDPLRAGEDRAAVVVLVGPMRARGVDGWRLYTVEARALATTDDVVAARTTPAPPDGNAGVALELGAAARDRIRSYLADHPDATGALVYGGDVIRSGPLAAMTARGTVHVAAREPMPPDPRRIAARFGGAPIPVPTSAYHAARLAPALLAGIVALVLVLVLTRR